MYKRQLYNYRTPLLLGADVYMYMYSIVYDETPVPGIGIIWFRRGKIDPFGGARCLSGTVAKKSDKGPAYVPAKSILS